MKKGRGSEGGEDGRERRGGNARVGKATPFDREDNKPVKLRMNCSCQWGRQGEHERKGAQGIEAKGGEAKGGEVERRRGAKGNEGEAKGRGEHMRDTGRKKGNEREWQSEREREREREKGRREESERGR